MKIAKMLVLTALIAPFCRADDSLTLANKLLDLSGTASFMQQSFEAGLKPSLMQLKARGAPDELVLAIQTEAKNYFQENFKWDDVKPKVAKLYTDNYTDAELSEIVAFDQTPAGQKEIEKTPSLMQQSMVIAMANVQTNMPEFRRRVDALLQDYQKKAQAAKAAAAAAAPAPSAAAPAPATVTAPGTITVPPAPAK